MFPSRFFQSATSSNMENLGAFLLIGSIWEGFIYLPTNLHNLPLKSNIHVGKYAILGCYGPMGLTLNIDFQS